jgi:simple sugar transport system permease protein
VSEILDTLNSSLRIATPLLFATMGGVLSERAGVVNLALESYVLAGAFGAAAGTLATGSLATGMVVGVAAALAVALLHGLVCTRTRADHVVAGVAMNLLVDAGTIAGLVSLYRQKGRTPGFAQATTGALNAARIGPFSPLTLAALASVAVVAFVLARTKPGLRLRAVGENPECAESLGVSAKSVRLWAVLAAGAVAGLGGVYLAFDAQAFSKQMAGGRGYLALAAVVIGKWRPLWAALAAFAFAALSAVANRMQMTLEIPDQFTQALPYVVTLAALAGVVGRAKPPAALGRALD